MEKHKVVILGSGIAGLSLGLYLKELGVDDFIILNPMNHNIHKACTGLLTEKTVNLLKELQIPLDGYEKAKIIKAFYNVQEVKDYSNSGLSLYHHDESGRNYLDDALYNKCLLNQINILENCGKINIDDRNKVVTFNDTRIAYDMLVDARGFYIDAEKTKHKDFGFEVKIKHKEENIIKTSKIIMNDYLKGYAWVIYSSKFDVIGFVDEYRKDRDYSKVYQQIAKQYYEKIIEDCEKKGAFVPTKPLKLFINKSHIQIGDKAGLVDPLTQEGIYYAMVSAKAAAFAIKDNHLRQYIKTMKPIVRNFKFASSMRNLFFSKTFQNKMWTLAGQHQFSDYLFSRFSNDDYFFSYSSLPKYRQAYKNKK